MAELPRGTVTFLFTDLEGSTRLWQTYPAAMPAAYERHDKLLRDAVAMYGGVAYKTIGDAVQVAFPTAHDALAAALEAQLTLTFEGWPTPEPLRVRMALHAGAVAPDPDGDYRSPVLNRLGRLLGAGHGGQVLLSTATYELVRDHLPEGSALRDLGEQRLKDLFRPERVWQLLHPDLPADFPPLKTLDGRPHNLPLQPTPLIGREREVAQVVALLRRADVRLATLTGPGGTGKTRLGLQAAADLLDDVPDGAWFVDLAPLADPALVPSAIAAALGVREEGGRPLEATLRAHLADKRLLLLLDNFEHVLDAAPLVAELLTGAPGLKALATSRVRLQLRGEHERPVPPLGLPRRKPPPAPEQLPQYEAVRLFVARAEAAAPDFAVTNATAPAVAEICHRLDGLPLAIELAAARVKLFPPEALLKRLERRLQVLTGGARDLPMRQQTLRGAIAWSHDLLAPEEQILFRRLAVFAGGCAYEAAEAVGDPDGELDAFAGLTALVDQSLLRQTEAGSEPRLSMLETVREYALERLEESGEGNAVRRRHATQFLVLVEQAEPAVGIGLLAGGWLERLEAEHDNLRAALAWALAHDAATGLRLAGALSWFWWVRGHLGEGRLWLERTLTAGGDDAGAARAAVLDGAGMLAWTQGDYERAAALHGQALALAEAEGDAADMVRARQNLAIVAGYQGDADRARDLYEAALAAARALGEARWLAVVLHNYGLDADDWGDRDRAMALLEEGVGIARGLGPSGLLGSFLGNLGVFRLQRGDVRGGVASVREGLALELQAGSTYAVAGGLQHLARAMASEHPAEAARWLGSAAASVEAIGGVFPPPVQAELERARAALRAALGEAAFAAAWAAGRALPMEQAVAEALAVADEVAVTGPGPLASPATERT